MTLFEFLTSEEKSLTAFAEAGGWPVTTVHGWKTGRRMPSVRDLVEIERLTDGRVTAADFVAHRQRFEAA